MTQIVEAERRSRGVPPYGTAEPPILRPAREDDLASLISLEITCFSGDRITRRGWRTFLRHDSAAVLVAERHGTILGAAVLRFNRATAIARIYSIAVTPEARGLGLGRALLTAALAVASDRDRAIVRLETRVDNRAAQHLFAEAGFTVIGRASRYYEDGADALRLERSLWNDGAAEAAPPTFPYYPQSLDFTCGPAALMMAMASLCPDLTLDRRLEIRLWREATTIFMASGHGGCGPYGLALAAFRQGFGVTVYAPSYGPMFVDSVRDPIKKDVIALVEEDMCDELRRTPVVIRRGPLNIDLLLQHMRRGEVPVVLISLYRLHGEKGPHWVTLAGFDGHVFRVFDPMESGADAAHGISIARSEFERIYRYGRRRQAAAVIIARRPTS
ncbi:MAG TPA: GNAT family N-acetyltransferase/peptidase C39 family protein [Stellaceae bacterium]|nr:GNAT family N-acetyltransferase/peptidase C39 family protein [Stellaceae bacterium]